MASLVPVECPHGHRMPVRLPARRIEDLVVSVKCPRCRVIYEGRPMVRVWVGITVIRLE